MVNPVVFESMRRLAHDLRRIREKRRRSLQAVHNETKIALELLQHFERTALYDHERYNPVYLRSFARTYASALGIDPAQVLEALELAQEGLYRNQLAVQYLGEAPLPEEGGTMPEEITAITPERPAEVEEEASRTSETPALPLSVGPGGLERLERRSQWRIGGVIVLLLAVVIGFLWWWLRPLPAPEPLPLPSPAVVPVDTGRAVLVPETTTAVASALRWVLGDTIIASVIAAFDKVDPIRIRVDNDLRRPYWIEQGDTLQLSFTQRIILEEQLNDIQLLLDGHPYPTDRRDLQGRLVITREGLQAYLDSLAR